MRVEIPLRAWARGQGLGKGTFVSAPGPKKCLMGFILNAFGIRDEELLATGSLSTLPMVDVLTKVPAAFYTFVPTLTGGYLAPSDVTWDVTTVNDDDTDTLTDDERMEALTVLLAKVGIDLVFYDDQREDVEPDPPMGRYERLAALCLSL